MNLYVRIINNVIEYIEQNISEPIKLQNLSDEFFISEFHFSRLFKVIVGISLKQYILGRKMTVAAEKLISTNNTVFSIAHQLGFEYPETFSRAFKKQFNISPTHYRNKKNILNTVPKAQIVERDIMNLGGILTLKEDYIYFDSFNLYGKFIKVDEKNNDFSNKLNCVAESVLDELKDNNDFYSVVSCNGDESGSYNVFFGMKKNENMNSKKKNIPAGWYARFSYYGNMLDMRTTFNDDFYRWLVIKEIKPLQNGIGMINIYNSNDLHDVKILIPIKSAT